jgi:cell division protein FtsN
MHKAFDEEEFEPVSQRRDTELTLGSFMLLGLFLGLALLCGLFFGLGYAVGHRGAAATQPAAPPPAAVAPNPSSAEAPHSKPSASVESVPAQPQPDVDPSSTALPTAGTNPESNEQISVTANLSGSSVGQRALRVIQTVQTLPSVRPAPPPQPAPQSAARLPAGGIKAQPIPSGVLMVQIAAVSHSEDAEVLVAALRRRGYAVTMSRDAADSQLHVRIGPFSNRNQANAIRDKLLNDGYNAMVQP